MCVTANVFAEYEEVIRRPKFNRAEAEIDSALQSIRERSVWVRPTEMIRACSDPKDDMFLECANAAGGRVYGDWQQQALPGNMARDSGSDVRSVIGSCVDWGARWACELKLPQYSNMLNITTCPTCGSKNIKRVRKAWKGTALGQGYIVPNLIYHQCGDRGEQVFDREAMRRIEAATPLGVELRLLKHLM